MTNLPLIKISFVFIFILLTASFGYSQNAPQAIDIRNFPIQNIAGRAPLLPLLGRDPDGSIVSFTIKSLPAPTAGTLTLAGSPVSVGKVLTPSEAKQLQFAPVLGYVGNATFSYSAHDNSGLSSSNATFTIPILAAGAATVCTTGKLSSNVLGAEGTFSSPYIIPNNAADACTRNATGAHNPPNNIGQPKPITNYTYVSTSNGLGPEGTYTFIKTLGTGATGNCIKSDWRGADHTGDGGYFMAINGSNNVNNKRFFTKNLIVCPNTLYEFSAFATKLVNAGSDPEIRFIINGTTIAISGKLPWKGANVWSKLGGLWYSGPNTSVTLEIENNNFDANGNDIGLDDISLAVCGPEITYPSISINPKFCNFGVLPLQSTVTASINTYSAYIFQLSTDGGNTWTDLGSAKIGDPVYNSSTNSYTYTATYGDIPITPAMNGYRYRLKVASELENLSGLACNTSADQIITVSAFTKPDAGPDVASCSAVTSMQLKAAGADETWAPLAGNPVNTTVSATGLITGLTVNGVYRYTLSNVAGCVDTVDVTRGVPYAGDDQSVCAAIADLGPAPYGYFWEAQSGNPGNAAVNPSTGAVTGMVLSGNYRFVLTSITGGCTDPVLITRTDCQCNGIINGNFDNTPTGEYGAPGYINGWRGVGADKVKIVSQGGNKGALIKKDIASLQQTIASVQPSTAYTLNLTYRNWTDGCSNSSNAKIKIEVYDNLNRLLATSGIIQATNNIAADISIPFTTFPTSQSITIKITDADSPPPSCGGFVDNIFISSPISISENVVNVKCKGGTTGAFDFAVSGGAGPYTVSYSFNSGPSIPITLINGTASLTNLMAGNYLVTVIDINGCAVTKTITVEEPQTALSVTATPIACFGDVTGLITATATGGTPGYTYQLGAETNTIGVFENLPAGTYTILVTDANGCTVFTSATIAQPTAPLSASITPSQVDCHGSTTGEITVSASGGVPGYTFTLNGNTNTTGTFTGLPAGNYTVLVRDANGCTFPANTTINQPAAPLSGVADVTAVKCFGAATGTVSVSASGGTPGYNFTLGAETNTTGTFSGLPAGDYTVVLKDAEGCLFTIPVTITQPATALTATANPVRCFGETTGSIQVTATGGKPGYTYSLGSITNTTGYFANLSAGTYTVTVTDSENCTTSASATITEPTSAIFAVATPTHITCRGATGEIKVNVNGGVPGYTFTLNGITNTSGIFTDLPAGNYTITIVDANGCPATANTTVNEPPTVLSATASTTSATCFGFNDGTISVTAAGGTPGYTFTLGGVTNNTGSFSGLVAGDYTVLVTDNAGCTTSVSVQVSQPSPGLSATASPVSCFGQATGLIVVSATGGTPGYSYRLGAATNTSGVFENLTAGAYTIIVTDAAGCTASASATIGTPSAPVTGTAAATHVSCFNGNDGKIKVTPSGGVPGYSFTLNGISNSTGIFSDLPAGNYTVIITDANGCSAPVNTTINQPAAALSGTAIATAAKCYGETTGTISLSASGGTPGYTFTLGSVTNTSGSFVNLPAGIYTVIITDSKGCSMPISATVTEPITSLSATADPILCFGQANGAIKVTASGGTPSYVYTLGSQSNTTGMFENLTSGTHTVTVTDANGCTTFAAATITEPLTPVSGIVTSTDANCYGGSDGTINVDPSGGVPGYTFTLNGITNTSGTFANLPAGIYSIIITDANGCTNTVTGTINQPSSALTASAIVTPVKCFGEASGSVTVTATGGTAPYQYTVGGVTNTTGAFGALPAGIHTIIIEDAKGCIASISITITEPTTALSATASPVRCFGDATGSVTVQAKGGTPGYVYRLGAETNTSGIFNTLPSGTYIVHVTDAAGCLTWTSVSVVEPPAPVSATVKATDVSCFRGSDGSITVSPSGGVSGFTFTLNGVTNTSGIFTDLPAGNYSIIVRDANGCPATVTALINEPALSLWAVASSQPAKCFGEANGSILVIAGGGTPGHTFTLNGVSNTTGYFTGLAAGDYTIIVRDSKGCIFPVTTQVGQPSMALTASAVPAKCFGDPSGSIVISATGGTPGYTYSLNGINNNSGIFDNLAAGTYHIIVTDAFGCLTSTAATIIEPPSPLTATANSTGVSCFGAADGSIKVTPSGGVPGYVFRLNGNNNTNGVFDALPAGTYSVDIIDANGCSFPVEAIVSGPNAALSLAGSVTPVKCFGESNGAVLLSATGGTSGYTYTLGTTSNTSGAFNKLAAGTYTFSVKDAGGCTTEVTISIPQPSTELSAKAIPVKCFGSPGGSINVEATGGTAPYVYTLGSQSNNTGTFNNLTAGTYLVTVTDANGCSTWTTATIAEPAAPLSISTSTTPTSCVGSSDGSARVTPSGGIAPYTVTLGNLNNTSGIFNDLPAGVYSITVTDANGCSAVVDITITEPAVALSASATVQNVKCFGGTDGAVTVSATGGGAGYTYTLNGLTNITGEFKNLPVGDYLIIVKDANGCRTEVAATITGPSVSLSAEANPAMCFGNPSGSVRVVAHGGTPGYTYTLNGTSNNTGIFNNLPAGSYLISVTDAAGCFAWASTNITQPSAPLTATAIPTDVTCRGAATGEIRVIPSGGIPGYRFNLNGTINTTGRFENLPAGNYTVFIEDGNGCPTSVPVTLNEPSSNLSATVSITSVQCFGESNGTISVSASGGTSGYLYTLGNTSNTTGTFSGLPAGNYTISVRDAGGCETFVSAGISQPATELQISAIPVHCFGSTSGSIRTAATGGRPGYTYTLGSASNTTGIFDNLTSGTYIISVTDANGCLDWVSVTLTQPGAPISATTSITHVNCNSANTGILRVSPSGGTPGYTFQIGGTSNTTGIFYDLPSGNYLIDITDANGCTEQMSATINQPSAPLSATAIATAVKCFGDKNGSIQVTGHNGTAGYTYILNGQSNTAGTFNNLSAGNYSVVIRDAKGCLYFLNDIIVGPGNCAPMARNEEYTIAEDETLSAAFPASDPDGDQLNYSLITNPLQGTLTPVNGAFEFLPPAHWSGSVTFDYRACDPKGLCATGTITITVLPVNDPPVAGDDHNTTAEDTPVSGDIASNDSDPDNLNSELTFTVIKNPSNGVIVLNPSGTYIYTPNEHFNGQDTIRYRVTDPAGLFAEADLIITVTPVNDPPTAVDDFFEIEQESRLTACVCTNDSDVENDPLSYTVLTPPSHGTLNLSPSGDFIYIPDADFTGEETFTYTVCDPAGECDTATVKINVLPTTVVNLTPVISYIREGKKASVKAELVRPFKDDVIVTLSYEGTAQGQKDYVLQDNFTRLRIPKGSLISTDQTTVHALSDDLQEPEEDVRISITGTSDALVKIGTGARVIILDVPRDTTQTGNYPPNKDISTNPLVSPNEDGSGNDFFKIDNIISFPENEVVIYNRWGNEVFRIKGYNESDKVFKGFANTGLLTQTSEPLVNGVYYFVIYTYPTIHGTKEMRLNKGYFILKR